MSIISDVLTPFQTFRYYFKQMAPVFWGVSIMPYYIGWSLASYKLYPTQLYPEAFLFFIGLFAVGPFLGGATILYNDYYDRFTDKHSRRKKHLPLLIGLVEPRSVHRLSIALFILAFLSSLFVSVLFAFLVFLCILLSYVYSKPPFRFKERPGLDLATNIFGSAVLCSFSGWIVVRSFFDFPFFWVLLPVFGVGAIYAPTTIIDYESDLREGVRTIATFFGKKKTFYLGLACVIFANFIIVIMSLSDYIISLKFLSYTWPLIFIEIFLYWFCLRKLDFTGGYYAILSFSLLAAVGNGLILLYHAGYLILS